MKLSIAAIRPFLAYITARDFPAAEAHRILGITPKTALEADTSVELHAYAALIEAATSRLIDQRIGLHYGHFLNLRGLQLAYEMSRKCQTVGEALAYLAEYFPQNFPAIELLASLEDGYLKLIVVPHPAWSDAHVEAAKQSLLAQSLLVYREVCYMLGENAGRVMLGLREEKTELDALRKMSGITARRAADCMIAFPEAYLDAKFERPQAHRLEYVLGQYAEMIQETRGSEEGFATKSKLALLHLMGKGALPQVDEVAWLLDLSRRSFQRRLKSENMIFRELLEDVLQRLSMRFLKHPTMSVAEIALALGYSEPAAFIHAFQRWFGKSPLEMRESA